MISACRCVEWCHSSLCFWVGSLVLFFEASSIISLAKPCWGCSQFYKLRAHWDLVHPYEKRRDLDQTHPHDAQISSRVTRTYHTHFGVPIGSQPGWWDDQKLAVKPTLPSYLRHSISNHLSRTLSRDFLVTTWISSILGNSNTEFLMSSGSALNATGTVCKMKNMSS